MTIQTSLSFITLPSKRLDHSLLLVFGSVKYFHVLNYFLNLGGDFYYFIFLWADVSPFSTMLQGNLSVKVWKFRTLGQIRRNLAAQSIVRKANPSKKRKMLTHVHGSLEQFCKRFFELFQVVL
ncbi:hypothetical protein ACS0TY_004356 [Phlomoides rotata]